MAYSGDLALLWQPSEALSRCRCRYSGLLISRKRTGCRTSPRRGMRTSGPGSRHRPTGVVAFYPIAEQYDVRAQAASYFSGRVRMAKDLLLVTG